jgi:hypothetical protein
MNQIIGRFDQLKCGYNFYEVITVVRSDNVNQHNKCFEILTMKSYTNVDSGGKQRRKHSKLWVRNTFEEVLKKHLVMLYNNLYQYLKF